MSVHKTTDEQARAEILKTVRALIRLRHSLEADRELNEILPRVELTFDAALTRGKVLSIADVKRAVGL